MPQFAALSPKLSSYFNDTSDKDKKKTWRVSVCPNLPQTLLKDFRKATKHHSDEFYEQNDIWMLNARDTQYTSVVVRRPHFQTWISLKPVG